MELTEFRSRVRTITRKEIKEFLGTPEGKALVREIVIDQQPKEKRPETAASKKPAKAEKAVKSQPKQTQTKKDK